MKKNQVRSEHILELRDFAHQRCILVFFRSKADAAFSICRLFSAEDSSFLNNCDFNSSVDLNSLQNSSLMKAVLDNNVAPEALETMMLSGGPDGVDLVEEVIQSEDVNDQDQTALAHSDEITGRTTPQDIASHGISPEDMDEDYGHADEMDDSRRETGEPSAVESAASGSSDGETDVETEVESDGDFYAKIRRVSSRGAYVAHRLDVFFSPSASPESLSGSEYLPESTCSSSTGSDTVLPSCGRTINSSRQGASRTSFAGVDNAPVRSTEEHRTTERLGDVHERTNSPHSSIVTTGQVSEEEPQESDPFSESNLPDLDFFMKENPLWGLVTLSYRKAQRICEETGKLSDLAHVEDVSSDFGLNPCALQLRLHF